MFVSAHVFNSYYTHLLSLLWFILKFEVFKEKKRNESISVRKFLCSCLTNRHFGIKKQTVKIMVDSLQSYNVLQCVMGFPPNDHYAHCTLVFSAVYLHYQKLY